MRRTAKIFDLNKIDGAALSTGLIKKTFKKLNIPEAIADILYRKYVLGKKSEDGEEPKGVKVLRPWLRKTFKVQKAGDKIKVFLRSDPSAVTFVLTPTEADLKDPYMVVPNILVFALPVLDRKYKKEFSKILDAINATAEEEAAPKESRLRISLDENTRDGVDYATEKLIPRAERALADLGKHLSSLSPSSRRYWKSYVPEVQETLPLRVASEIVEQYQERLSEEG